MKISNRKIELKDKEGKIRIGRKISVSSIFDCPPEIMWEKILDLDTLIEICKPKASFKSVSENPQKSKAVIFVQLSLSLLQRAKIGCASTIFESKLSRLYSAFTIFRNYLNLANK